VAICRDESEASATWENWRRSPTWKRRLYAWRNRIRGRALAPDWMAVDDSLIVNQFIPGKPAMCLVAAVKGRVLGGLTALKEKCYRMKKGRAVSCGLFTTLTCAAPPAR